MGRKEATQGLVGESLHARIDEYVGAQPRRSTMRSGLGPSEGSSGIVDVDAVRLKHSDLEANQIHKLQSGDSPCTDQNGGEERPVHGDAEQGGSQRDVPQSSWHPRKQMGQRLRTLGA